MRTTVLACAIAWCLVTVSVATASTPAQLPTKYTNLQVLPKDIEPKALVLLMKSFAQGLAVRCEHCHVGEGDDLSKFDFAADTKAPKETARKMIRMMITINEELLAGVGEPAAPGTRKVTCYTCHRGNTKPLTARPVEGGT